LACVRKLLQKEELEHKRLKAECGQTDARKATKTSMSLEPVTAINLTASDGEADEIQGG
jgi:hypothetical protein